MFLSSFEYESLGFTKSMLSLRFLRTSIIDRFLDWPRTSRALSESPPSELGARASTGAGDGAFCDRAFAGAAVELLTFAAATLVFEDFAFATTLPVFAAGPGIFTGSAARAMVLVFDFFNVIFGFESD